MRRRADQRRRVRGAMLLVLPLIFVSVASAQSITPDQPLAFGSLAPSPAGGTVTVLSTGGRNLNGIFAIGSDPFGAATFIVEVPKANPHYTILLPSSATLTNGTGGSMLVDGFESSPSLVGRVNPPSRSATLAVGATLHVSGTQAGGSYTGTFPVIVNLGN